ncbi:MAG TPA: hypothetical protein VK140_04300 [Ktedonobacteraceae bacterium]|nr:hypothetical protein [Ktedonobacteraceae bacterium]
MPEKPLQVRIEATDQHPGQFTLSFNSSQYPLTLNPDANVTFSDWLRRLQPVLAGQDDPSGELAPQALLRNVGTWLWQALLPDGAPVQERDELVQVLRTGHTPLLLVLPDALAGLPWELLCDPHLLRGVFSLAAVRLCASIPLIHLRHLFHSRCVCSCSSPRRQGWGRTRG